MKKIIRVGGEYYISARSSVADDFTRVLKKGEAFALFDRHGDINPLRIGDQGLFYEGTRHLSQLTLRLGNDFLLLLSSTVHENNALLTVDLTNTDARMDGGYDLRRGDLHIQRNKFLWDGVCYERISISNYTEHEVKTVLQLGFEADFADIFEVRGSVRKRRGTKLESEVDPNAVVLRYQGLDGVERRTRLCWSRPGASVTGEEATFDLQLRPRLTETFEVLTVCESSGWRTGPVMSYASALERASDQLARMAAQRCRIETSNEQFNDWLNRAYADIQMMVTETSHGLYPYAGVPWYSTVFGRDGLITAFQMLWIDPSIAAGVLRFLAAHQAQGSDPESDAEPGKILHELRRGEMAALGEIPFGCYYGSVDSTPLFIMLAGLHLEVTGDVALARKLWPQIERALRWLDEYGDADGDGFVEYSSKSSRGLRQQGWKDSLDSVFHADGSDAQGPIALCEVQGYVYAARRAAARIARTLNKEERARALSQQANLLRERFDQAFWCDEIGSYALALDGEKRPCRVRSSNAGQCLFTGLALPLRANRLSETLLSQEMFSGWGVRTLGVSEKRYNPMSYHNGSVWPHDNALIACGLARYGLKQAAMRILTGLFDASLFADLHRLPELFCGFPRRPGEGPTLYPVACSPQAWASASVFLLLQATLGLSIDVPRDKIRMISPMLPESLQEVRITNLRVGECIGDLTLYRYPEDVGVNIHRREGEFDVLVMK